MELRSTIARVRGIGAAKEGVGHWWAERISAIALLPLVLWFVFSAVSLAGADYATFRLWAGSHGNALLLVLLVIALFQHTQLGLTVIIEDYVNSEARKTAAIIAVKFAALACAASSILAVLRITFGG